ncbi:MAG TPA: FAD-binding oxidoreductase [Terriglobales bacterium]|nr:FAD-binding oxidoreductase [Terriglobales bacterium]
MLTSAILETLKRHFRGELLTPADTDYDSQRKIFNVMFDRRPALIARCSSADDVVTCIQVARDAGLDVTVRGGGHSAAGNSVADGSLMIDLSAMKAIKIDPVRKRLRAQAGLRLGEVDRATHELGLATPLGTVTRTGIAGLTLGGGLGWLNGRYGLACDNVTSFDVVTAHAQRLAASAQQHPDLHWALRGGSGNFGVVTSFEYQLHPVKNVFAGLVVYPFSAALDVLTFFFDYAPTTTDELTTAVGLLTLPDGTPAVGMIGCYCGDRADAERVLQPLRNFGTPMEDTFQWRPYVEVQAMFDPMFPEGNYHYWKTHMTRTVTGEGLGLIVEAAARKLSPHTLVFIQHIHGAAARVPVADTAFPHRGDRFDVNVLAQWTNPGETEANVAWTRELDAALRSHVDDSVYVNSLEVEGTQGARAAYGANYDRLVEIKTRYDPTNFFHHNANIVPRGAELARSA